MGLGWLRWWLRRRGAEAEAGPLLQMRGSSHRLRGRTGSQLQSSCRLPLRKKTFFAYLLLCSFSTYVDKFLKEKWYSKHKAGWFVWKSQVPGSSQLVLTTGQWPVWEKGNFDQVKGLCRCPEAHQQMTKKLWGWVWLELICKKQNDTAAGCPGKKWRDLLNQRTKHYSTSPP